MLTLVVPAGDAPQRLDVFLAHTLPGGSRQRTRVLIQAGNVTVNGRRCPKGCLVNPGDRVDVVEWEEGAFVVEQQGDLQLSILYEDDWLVAVDKAAGIPCHPLHRGERGSVASFLVARFPEMLQVGSDVRQPGLVHRLDTDTSGVLLAARSQDGYTRLRGQFRAGNVQKEYLALVVGRVARPGRIEKPIAHHPRSPSRMRVADNPRDAERWRARPALTIYEPLEEFREATLLRVEIVTGVRHQIRAHLQDLGHPVLADALYGGGAGPRQMLHARSIRLTHPGSSKSVRIDSPTPADFEAQMARLRGPSDGSSTIRSPSGSSATRLGALRA
jgi:23S rRNA pseudouridine1911/1915/1917 synthase